MAELTEGQKKALANAAARKLAAEQSGTTGAIDAVQSVVDYLNPMQGVGRQLGASIANDMFGTQPAKDARDNTLGKIDATVRGAADTMSFGTADEIAAAMDAGLNPIIGTGNDGETFGDRWSKNVAMQRATDRADEENRFKQRLGGQIAGGITQGVGLVKAGLSPTAYAIKNGAGLLKTGLMGVLEGGTLGAAQGLGSGEDLPDRLDKAAKGGIMGAIVGGAAPAVIQAGRNVISAIPFLRNPQGDQNAVIAALMRKSGKTADEITAELAAAQADDQGVYTVADALGQPGQRVVSSIVRTPNDARAQVYDALMSRQMGQGDRLSSALADGFDATDTAAQRVAGLTSARDAAANADYSALRAKYADAPLWNDALKDLTSRPSVQQAIRDASKIARERGYSVTNPFVQAEDGTLTLPEGTAPNFTFWDTVKRGLDEQIGATGNRDVSATKKALTGIIDELVPDYAAAREPFAKASRAIEAVDKGTNAARGRVRSQDVLDEFAKMTPEEQAAYRAGYAEPLIARVEGTPMTATSNKARPLMSPKTEAEFPVIAAPGQADRLGTRIAREQRMFETANAALGGSKTADNLADAADETLDPALMAQIARGDFKGATMSALLRLMNSARGLNPRVLAEVAPQLMETNPDVAAALFKTSAQKMKVADDMRARIAAALLANTGAATGRAAP